MRITIIDDDPLSIFLTENMLLLENAALHINTYQSAHEALQELIAAGAQAFPDVLILDLNMPVMDGWELLDILTQLDPALSRQCRIYVLTSSLDVSDMARANAYSIVTGLLHKPLQQADIQSIQAASLAGNL